MNTTIASETRPQTAGIWKYFLAFTMPAMPLAGLTWGGAWAWLTPVILFGLLPALELVMSGTIANADEETESKRAGMRVYDLLLYLNLPALYLLLAYLFYAVQQRDFSALQWAGNLVSVGMVCGAIGINIGHELGHRKPVFEQRIAQALLLGSLYLHFFIEHNRGHHRWVATPHDPATARRGETLYAFWLRSLFGSWRNACRLEAQRLQKAGRSPWSLQNQMIRFQLIQLLAVFAVGVVFSPWAAAAFITVGLIGALMLETVNYLEHYGLRRQLLRPGVYEPVKPCHSWNSNHSLGRIMLFELTRHADHHYRASRKYQVLRHHENSPQLPTGYPGMMLLSLVPPLWFRVMNPRVDALHSEAAAAE